MTPSVADELLSLSQQLLDAIDNRNWAGYRELCDPELTAFEPEATGHLVTGMDFHKFYFELERPPRPRQSSIVAPRVRIMETSALVTYVRLVQQVDDDGGMSTTAFEETRIWQQQAGRWKHVHFHRSKAASVSL